MEGVIAGRCGEGLIADRWGRVPSLWAGEWTGTWELGGSGVRIVGGVIAGRRGGSSCGSVVLEGVIAGRWVLGSWNLKVCGQAPSV